MSSFSRREFLGTALAGLAGGHVLGQDKPVDQRLTDDPAFLPDTLFLTWQRDPTTTMTVQWVGTRGETSNPSVYFTDNPAGRWQVRLPRARAYPKTDFKVFRTELSGLAPGTDYHFKIGRHSPTYRFRTMPAKATDTIHFVSGGDCGVNAHAVANNIEAARHDPMFALIGGDLGYDNGRSVEISLAFLRNYSKHMVDTKGRLIPMVAAIGNHEVNGGYGKSRENAPFFYALFDGLFPETGYATLDFGDYLSFVLLDTGHTSPIAGAQTDWLETQLRARKDHPHVLVVNHVPAYPSYRPMQGKLGGDGTGAGNRKHWVPLFEQYRVPVVLEHHDHTFKRTKPLLYGLANDDGVLYLGDGSWGRLRTPHEPQDLAYLSRTNRDFHFSLHRIQGDDRYHLALDERGRVMDLCRSGQRPTGLVRTSG